MATRPTVVTHESGLESTPLPIWTDDGSAIEFGLTADKAVSRVNLQEVPGSFQLLNVLSHREADAFVELAEQMGFHQDAPVSLPHSVRHNENLNWVVSTKIDSAIWQRSMKHVPEVVNGQLAKGLNARFRFYRYGSGDFFSLHSDGAWPGSRIVDGELVADAYPGWRSHFTYLIFLNDGYGGGRTQFLVSKSDPEKPASSSQDSKVVNVVTPKGAALCFPHGSHPLHCMHAGETISSGIKYIIRTDILFGDPNVQFLDAPV